jgi:hypothetical protein
LLRSVSSFTQVPLHSV